jgi:sugar transferase (PEP-CTERM/EpsH1 system associated)
MRVLNIVDSLGIGGTELGLANVIERTREQVEHAVCCVRVSGATAVRLQAHGVPVAELNKAPGNDWSVPLRVARLCRDLAPDIVHTRNWGSIDGIIGARLARVPVVIHGEHGRDVSDPDGTNRRRNRARRVLSAFVDRMVAVSDQLGRWLIEDVGIRARKVSVLENGVDAQKFMRRDNRAALRARHGYTDGDVVVGTVGRLDPVKNQAGLIEALSALRPAHPRLRVVIAGDGPEREILARQIESAHLGGTATLLGHRDDIPGVLSMLDIFVLPSLGEGMCNTILEAMAAGLPVVATRVGGNPELVVEGVTGALVPARDTGALAAAISRYTTDEPLRHDHGFAGRQRVLKEFTLERMADRYLELYKNELEKKAAANHFGWSRISDASRPAGTTRNHNHP